MPCVLLKYHGAVVDQCAPSSQPVALAKGAGRGARSHCRFVPPRVHFIPYLLTYSLSLFLKRQCDRILAGRRARALASRGRWRSSSSTTTPPLRRSSPTPPSPAQLRFSRPNRWMFRRRWWSRRHRGHRRRLWRYSCCRRHSSSTWRSTDLLMPSNASHRGHLCVTLAVRCLPLRHCPIPPDKKCGRQAGGYIVGLKSQSMRCPFAGRTHRRNCMWLEYSTAPGTAPALKLRCYKCTGHSVWLDHNTCAGGCASSHNGRRGQPEVAWLGAGSADGVCRCDGPTNLTLRTRVAHSHLLPHVVAAWTSHRR